MAFKKDKYSGDVSNDDMGFGDMLKAAMQSAAAGTKQEQENTIAQQNNEGGIRQGIQNTVNAANKDIATVQDTGAMARTQAQIKADAPYKASLAGQNNAQTAGVNLENKLKSSALPSLTDAVIAGAKLTTTAKQAETVDVVRNALLQQKEVGGDNQVGTSPGDFLAADNVRKLRDPSLALGSRNKYKIHSTPGSLK